jgi:hypothetical protein
MSSRDELAIRANRPTGCRLEAQKEDYVVLVLPNGRRRASRTVHLPEVQGWLLSRRVLAVRLLNIR